MNSTPWSSNLNCHDEEKTDRPCEPADPDLVHEVREALAGLQLVLAEHVLGQLSSGNEGGEDEEEQHAWLRSRPQNA